jgi:succinate dehydrogenase / fumarate reductase membrane anchor subunit
VALVPLVVWFVVSLIVVTGSDLDAVKTWVGKPYNSTLLLLTLLTGIWHGLLGMQVVIEDYVHGALTKHLSLIFIRLVAAFLAISVSLSTLKLALGG